MECYRAQVRHKNKLCKIIKKEKKNRMVTVSFCLLWSINNFGNAVSIIHLYIPHQWRHRPKNCCFLASFKACPHPRAWWHLCFLCPVPSLVNQTVLSFPITTAVPEAGLCWRGWAACHRFQHSQDFAWAESRVMPCLAGKPCSLHLPEWQQGKHLEIESVLPPSPCWVTLILPAVGL